MARFQKKVVIITDYSNVAQSQIELRAKNVIDTLKRHNETIKSHIPNWYPYETNYERATDEILLDSELYNPSGNQIFLWSSGTGGGGWSVKYDSEHRWEYESYFSSRAEKSHPFMMVNVVEDDRRTIYNLYALITSNQHSMINWTRDENVIEVGNSKILYSSLQYITRNSPTSCEFMYVITNKDWRSGEKTAPNCYRNKYENDLRQTHCDIGDHFNFVFGYILLSREQEMTITEEMQDNVATAIVTAMSELPDLFNEYGGSGGVAVPITFDAGNESVILQMVPEKLRSRVDAGYLQLRAYNQAGFPNAMCPGVKIDTYFAEYICFGGISNSSDTESGTCGDYAGWQGKGDTFGENGRSEYSHTTESINEAILIFYR